MVIARSLAETRPYVCKADRELPADKQTRFHLRALPATLVMSIEAMHDATQDGQVLSMRLGDRKKVTLAAGIAGWDNLSNDKGEAVAFRQLKGDRHVCGLSVRNPVDMDLVDQLPVDVVEELVDAINAANTVTEADAKN